MEHASPMAGGDYPIKVADLTRDELEAQTSGDTPLPQPQVIEVQMGPRAIDPERAAAVLPELMHIDGMLGCAVVNGATGRVIASEGSPADLELAAAAASEVMRAHRHALRDFGHHHASEHVDEVLVTAGNRYHVMRTVTAHNEYFVLALLDKLRSNLAMARFRIMEAQQSLA
jgi:predicted regulator of Ras-like GTPase activity (Roadblock/LC7/MglB family)